MNINTFEILVMTTLVLGFYIVGTILSEIKVQLRRLIRGLHGDSDADLEKLREIRELVISGKSGRAATVYRKYFGTSLAEAANAVVKLGSHAETH